VRPHVCAVTPGVRADIDRPAPFTTASARTTPTATINRAPPAAWGLNGHEPVSLEGPACSQIQKGLGPKHSKRGWLEVAKVA
jgi:hypothetical protein